jgi:hypothetical protein
MVLLEEITQLVAEVGLRLLVTIQMVEQILTHPEEMVVMELQLQFQDLQLLILEEAVVHFIIHLINHLVDRVAVVVEVIHQHLMQGQDNQEQQTVEVVEAVAYKHKVVELAVQELLLLDINFNNYPL